MCRFVLSEFNLSLFGDSLHLRNWEFKKNLYHDEGQILGWRKDESVKGRGLNDDQVVIGATLFGSTRVNTDPGKEMCD